MKFTELIRLRKTRQLSRACHAAKNLYNLVNYYVRQGFFSLNEWWRYEDLWRALKNSDAYKALPSQTSQQVLRIVDKNWKSFFRALKEWKARPERFGGRPRPPKYKEKNGEFVVFFTNQQCRIKHGFLRFPKRSGLPPVKTRIKEGLRKVRIVPKGAYYVLEIVHEREAIDLKMSKERIVGVDLGLNNVVTMANNAGLKPAVVKGGAIKSINQFYNKRRAKYSSLKDKQGLKFETRRLQALARRRNEKIHDFFHKISRLVVNYCVKYDFGTIVVGYNPSWKHAINIGRKNNQNFVQVPFFKFVKQLAYKAASIGIELVLIDESFTSKCSFLDGESIERHDSYQGNRVSRGLFRTSSGLIINADVNAAYNILKKAFPNAISADEIEGSGLSPYSIAIS
ncbi:MAG: transposase [Candidatus Lokiarchaeota archaeon]|nr:transposase [Candidatus Lokiarchaeota archaeon]